jgi:N-hydroxyarylamine O-acetyltransferase
MDKEEMVREYHKRIDYQGGMEPNEENLALLQYSHLLNVPYENLDILKGERISLDIDNLYDKIVKRRRGGYCFELNRLFGWLLLEMGYGVTNYVARYFRGESGIPKRRHHVLRVECADKKEYLCDVGVGAVIPMCPIPYQNGANFDQNNTIIDQNGAKYALKKDDIFGKILIEPHDNGWRWVYSFEELPQHEVDFTFASFWCEFAKESPFNKKYMLSIRRPGKRITIDDFTLKEFENSKVTERILFEGERKKALLEIFGIDLA